MSTHTPTISAAMAASCGEGELVGGVHTLVVRSVQVYHELRELKEEDKGREEVQEIERESQVEENHPDDHEHGDDMKDSNVLSRNACADDVMLTKLNERERERERETLRATLMWMSVEVVSGVRIVQCHAIIDVVIDVRVMHCHAIMDFVIGVHVMLSHQAIDVVFGVRIMICHQAI